MSTHISHLRLFAIASLTLGCEKEIKTLQSIYQNIQGNASQLGTYETTPGKSASEYLQRTLKDQNVDVSSLLKALTISRDDSAGTSLLDDNSSISEVTDDTSKFLMAGQRSKGDYKRADHSGIDQDFFKVEQTTQLLETDYTKDTINWSKSESEFTVSVAAKMPVRDQGQRGTCASFAGIGQVEGLIIKKYGVASIDLSEQRFYYMSKPDSWSTGGDIKKQGSDPGTGFAKSAGVAYNGANYPPGSASDFNIPLETNCAYNSKLGSNDLQIPQGSGCEGGVAKVTNTASWLSNYSQRLGTAQQVYDFLVKYDVPVVIATRLSQNWELNDGLVTLKGADGTPGDSSHAAGHAYLVVGARKIDDSKYPGEGGMCFIIKNSWGKGWGVNGYSCITLAWFNKWRFQLPFPVAYDASLDPTKFQEAKAYLDTKPKAVNDPVIDSSTGGGARRGTVSFLAEETSGYKATDFVLGSVRSDKDDFGKVLYIKGNGFITIRGILADGESTTNDLTLKLSDSTIYLPHLTKGDVEVGQLDHDNKIITLCSQKYASVCDFNYSEADKKLVVGLTKDEFDREDTSGPYEWKSFGIGKYKVEFSKPGGLNTRLDARFVNGDTTTNPLRFNLQPFDGAIQFGNRTIGNLTSGQFCSGNFAKVCRVVLSADKFNVLLKAKE